MLVVGVSDGVALLFDAATMAADAPPRDPALSLLPTVATCCRPIPAQLVLQPPPTDDATRAQHAHSPRDTCTRHPLRASPAPKVLAFRPPKRRVTLDRATQLILRLPPLFLSQSVPTPAPLVR